MDEEIKYETEEIFNILGQGVENGQQTKKNIVQRVFVWMKKKIVVKDNQAKANELFISPEQVFGDVEWKEFSCIAERKNWIYKDKKRTEEFASISYVCQTGNGNITFKRNSQTLLFPENFLEQDLDEIEESTRIRVRVGQARITIYKIEYGVAYLSILVDEVERVRG